MSLVDRQLRYKMACKSRTESCSKIAFSVNVLLRSVTGNAALTAKKSMINER